MKQSERFNWLASWLWVGGASTHGAAHEASLDQAFTPLPKLGPSSRLNLLGGARAPLTTRGDEGVATPEVRDRRQSRKGNALAEAQRAAQQLEKKFA